MEDAQSKNSSKKKVVTVKKKKKNVYKDLASSRAETKKKDRFPGFCDICLGTDGFRRMDLLECEKCGVKVHSACYAMSLSPNNNIDNGNESSKSRNRHFVCWACEAVGKQFKVREKDPFTSGRIAVTQRERPQECCLCSVTEGMHAMHPIYDTHGKRGRQIWLPPQKKGGERKLAWAHTLCALTVNVNPGTSGTCYGCRRSGYYGDPNDLEYLSDSESINSELDVELNEVSEDVHHFVYWGHLDRQLGNEADVYSRAIEKHKRELRCIFCGTDDSKMVKMPNGNEVYQSFRVPLQCTANNKGEFEEFKKKHKGGENCYQGLHVGCALWGRNEAGEQSLARRAWFFPGILDDPNPLLQNNVSEVYCDCHAQELLRGNVFSSNLEKKQFPGPFSAKVVQKKTTTAKKAPAVGNVSSTVGANAKDPLRMSKAMPSTNRPTKALKLHYQSLQGAPAQGADSNKRQASEQQKGQKPLKRHKTSHATDGKRTVTEKPVGNPIIPGLTRNSSASEALRKTSADAVALNQDKRKSKLVRAKEKKKTQSGGTSSNKESARPAQESSRDVSPYVEGDGVHLELTQKILDDLLLHKKKCKERKEKFKGTRVQRRLHWRSEVDLSKEEFTVVWRNAVDAMAAGNLDKLKMDIAAESSKKRAPETQKQVAGLDGKRSQVDSDNNSHSAEAPLPSIPRRKSAKSQKIALSSDRKSRAEDGDDSGAAESSCNNKDDNDVGLLDSNEEGSSQPQSMVVERPSHQADPFVVKNHADSAVADAETADAISYDKSGAQNEPGDKNLTEEEKVRQERIQNIVDDLVKKLDPLQPKDGNDGEAEMERIKEINLKIKACRSHWKKEFNLPTSEYKALFDHALDKVLEIHTWFKVNKVPRKNPALEAPAPAPVTGQAPETAQAPAAPPAQAPEKAPSATATDPTPIANNTMKERNSPQTLEQASSPPPFDHDDTTRRVSSPPVPSGQWSFLSIGKRFNKRGFNFDSWDKYEEVPPPQRQLASS